jgi:hypothetical protein
MNSQNIREACDDIEHAVTLGNEGFIGEVQKAVARIRGALTDEPVDNLPVPRRDKGVGHAY